jgi:hypothetical protein
VYFWFLDWKRALYEIVKHNPQLDVIFSNFKCHIVDKNNKEAVDIGIEAQGLFRLVSDETVQEHALVAKSG